MRVCVCVSESPSVHLVYAVSIGIRLRQSAFGSVGFFYLISSLLFFVFRFAICCFCFL